MTQTDPATVEARSGLSRLPARSTATAMDQGHLAKDTGAVRVDCLNSVATLTLDHPARHNALTFEMLAAIPLIVRELEADPAIRVIVLTGAGKNFSSGADIRDLDRVLHEGPPGGVLTAAEEALARTHIPTIAAIRGYCFGGGWQLASACDVRLAAADTRIAITPAKLGIMYPMTGLRRLLQLVGPAVTKRLLYSGESIGADRAESYGMADKAKNLDAEVAKLVDNISRRSRLTISGTGEVLHALLEGVSVDEIQATWEAESQRSGEGRIGRAAFLGRYEPMFSWVR